TARPVVEVAAASLRCAVEQLPGAVQHVGAAVVARVRVVDDAVLEGEGAQAVQLLVAEVDVASPRRAEVEAGAASALLLGEQAEGELKSLPPDETQGKLQPMRRL